MKQTRPQNPIRFPLAYTPCALFLLVLGAAPPEPPKVSAFAPAKPLEAQLEYFLGRLQSSLASEDAYDEAAQSRAKKDANTLIVLLMALGMHDQDNAWKSSAPALTDLAEKLAGSTGEYAFAREAIDNIVKAKSAGTTDGKPLQWEKRYRLGQLMKQVTFVNARLRRGLSPTRFKREADSTAEYAALLAVIAQAALVDTHEVKNPDQVDQWYELSAAWRDAAGALGEGARQQDFAAAEAAMKRMSKSCDDCHAVFRKEEN